MSRLHSRPRCGGYDRRIRVDILGQFAFLRIVADHGDPRVDVYAYRPDGGAIVGGQWARCIGSVVRQDPQGWTVFPLGTDPGTEVFPTQRAALVALALVAGVVRV